MESNSEENEKLYSRGREIIYRQLAMMDRSRKELFDALAERDIPETIADELLDACEESGLVDDEKFTQVFIEYKLQARKSSREIYSQLLKKGISPSLARHACEHIDENVELENACILAEKKLASLLSSSKNHRIRAGNSPREYGEEDGIAEGNNESEWARRKAERQEAARIREKVFAYVARRGFALSLCSQAVSYAYEQCGAKEESGEVGIRDDW